MNLYDPNWSDVFFLSNNLSNLYNKLTDQVIG